MHIGDYFKGAFGKGPHETDPSSGVEPRQETPSSVPSAADVVQSRSPVGAAGGCDAPPIDAAGVSAEVFPLPQVPGPEVFDPFEDVLADDLALQETPPPPGLVPKTGTASEKGDHARNDDCAKAGWWCGCFAVSDGIGGAPDGDYMSRVSCGAAIDEYEESRSLVKAFSAANAAAVRVSKWIDSPDCGATLLLGCLEGRRMHFAWVGDSLAFKLHDGKLDKITEEQRVAGTNALSAAVGYELGVVPDEAFCDVEPGDRILMCSDGVWCAYEETGTEDELVGLLSSGSNLPIVASRICKGARARWHDDATALVIEFDDAIPPSMTERHLPDADRTPSMGEACGPMQAATGLASDKTEELPRTSDSVQGSGEVVSDGR